MEIRALAAMSYPCDTMNMLFLNRITWSLAVAAGLLAAPLSAYRAPQQAVLALRTLDQRVAAVGHRLATFNVAVCGERQWHPGFMIHDLSQYARRSRQQAIARFGLGEGPAILALVPGSPAARAGLRLDDVLVVADGNLLPRPPRNTHDSFAPTERIIDALEVAFSDGAAELTIRRMGKDRAVLVAAELGCATRFQVTPSPLLQAKADGRYVQLTSAFVEYARGDHELAALLAHELAHNILRHRLRLKAAGADWGSRRSMVPVRGFSSRRSWRLTGWRSISWNERGTTRPPLSGYGHGRAKASLLFCWAAGIRPGPAGLPRSNRKFG
jgi:Zn-dependent protease with chaperone function